jgi:transcriptional regulator with PAS, ATPase and Fis domain
MARTGSGLDPAKPSRVLQQREVTPVGSAQPKPIDVQVIAVPRRGPVPSFQRKVPEPRKP